MVDQYKNYINGEWASSENNNTFETVNPAAPEEIVATYPDSTGSDANAAVKSAAAAQATWKETPAPERGEILREAGSILADKKDELAEFLTREEGKSHEEAMGEVQRAIDIFHYYAEKARDVGGSLKAASAPRTKLYTVKEPVGVAALITPWNYPIAIPAWKLAPALATGNSVVLKPASLSPGVAVELFKALDKAGLPDGVGNIVTGPGSTVGDAIITHDSVDAVSFTGSGKIGNTVYEKAVEDGKRVQTELGGKNPTIVSDTANVEEAGEIVASGAFGVTGQACTACSRAIVYSNIYDEFIDAVASQAEAIEVGPGNEYDMGPQVSKSELESTLDYIEIAQKEGASLISGGGQPEGDRFGDGHFVKPTVFADVDNDYQIAQEEVFGPVLSVIKAEGYDDALKKSNDVQFGLSASIVTDDHSEAEQFTRQIDAGVAKINEKTTGLELHTPFGGFKGSSSETWREQGDAGIDFYTIEKTIYNGY